jgi:hypothetical protein
MNYCKVLAASVPLIRATHQQGGQGAHVPGTDAEKLVISQDSNMERPGPNNRQEDIKLKIT